MVVKPGRRLPDGRTIGRIIMKVRQTNALMMVLGWDLDCMAWPSEYLSIVLEDGEAFLVGGEDMVSCFYLCEKPEAWSH